MEEKKEILLIKLLMIICFSQSLKLDTSNTSNFVLNWLILFALKAMYFSVSCLISKFFLK